MTLIAVNGQQKGLQVCGALLCLANQPSFQDGPMPDPGLCTNL